MTHAEALEAWKAAKKDSERARKALEGAKEKVREAQEQFNSAWDIQRRLWVQVQEAQYAEERIEIKPVKVRERW